MVTRCQCGTKFQQTAVRCFRQSGCCRGLASFVTSLTGEASLKECCRHGGLAFDLVSEQSVCIPCQAYRGEL